MSWSKRLLFNSRYIPNDSRWIYVLIVAKLIEHECKRKFIVLRFAESFCGGVGACGITVYLVIIKISYSSGSPRTRVVYVKFSLFMALECCCLKLASSGRTAFRKMFIFVKEFVKRRRYCVAVRTIRHIRVHVSSR